MKDGGACRGRGDHGSASNKWRKIKCEMKATALYADKWRKTKCETKATTLYASMCLSRNPRRAIAKFSGIFKVVLDLLGYIFSLFALFDKPKGAIKYQAEHFCVDYHCTYYNFRGFFGSNHNRASSIRA